MNYLAHLYLAEDSPESLLGSILGDFVKGAIGDRYPPKIKRGIELHRKIDAYTDSHPLTRASRNLYSPARRRFAGIIVDLCYDHLLYRHWTAFSDLILDRFISRVYDIFMTHSAMLPGRLQTLIPVMIREDWLGSYRDLSGVEKALSRLSARVTSGDRLLGAIEEIKVHYRRLEANFLIFFPDLIHFVQHRSDF
ncbi:MAG: ACP phosphodiesterase [Desulfobacterales bacterium]|jgi:acyl carrier protein phosphodiesterase